MKWLAPLLLLVLCACSDGKMEESHGDWSYEGDTGPEHWAELDPAWEIAAKGQSQSPIDLGEAKQGNAGTLDFHYLESAIRVTNTGHSVQLTVEQGSWVEIDGKRFHLKQFHLHSPSEHAVNGVYSDIEVHCVHESDDAKLAVVGFLMDAGPGSKNFDIFLANIPAVGETQVIPNFRTDIAKILPEDLNHKYHYQGSLTTPPCTENVEWIVLKSHSTISPEQIAVFRKYYQGNNRPLQPLNDRDLMVD
jgi:carbonic anhydrase